MVGNTDNSSPYYGAVSELWRMSGDNVTHLKFINYTSGISNWNNWNIVASHSQATGAMGGEYLVLRADLWENVGAGNSKPNITGDYDFGGDDAAWAQWRQNMNGAIVDVVIERAGATLTVAGTMTATNGSGAVYHSVNRKAMYGRIAWHAGIGSGVGSVGSGGDKGGPRGADTARQGDQWPRPL